MNITIQYLKQTHILSHTHTPMNTQISSSCGAQCCRCSPEALPSSSAPDSPSAHQTPDTQTQSSEVERKRKRNYLHSVRMVKLKWPKIILNNTFCTECQRVISVLLLTRLLQSRPASTQRCKIHCMKNTWKVVSTQRESTSILRILNLLFRTNK